MDLLLFPAKHPSHAFTRDELTRAIWQYSFYSDTSTVSVHMRRLRTKIGADPANPRHLQTVWGVGYRFEPWPRHSRNSSASGSEDSAG
ncbi:MAG: winged helix-turn-helix domain-containing protein [Solirubrobacterales bacterium]|nr:winged helix-turn-helix domain-containing protein [Solirubrobacterales bacterium]MBV9422662.1 winged helix-turn-helix domain-containing protein [Solirubrobacterales bacterium]MBV9799788.1 winged helix-turn-helix domain-containing protein [Solirubrobacterales bacterium]